MVLSPRLSMIASLIEPGFVMADIGTDHAHLPIRLVEEGICPSAIAMDVRKGPLNRAEANIRQHGLQDRIRTRLSDGLQNLQKGEVQCAVLAGMGGPLIRDILQASSDLAHSFRFMILQPQSEAGLLRHYLQDNGFVIDREEAVRDAGKYYQMFRVKPYIASDAAGAGCADISGYPEYAAEEDFCYGKLLIDAGHPVLETYLQQQEEKVLALQEQMKDLPSQRAQARHEELIKELGLIRAALARIRTARKQ